MPSYLVTGVNRGIGWEFLRQISDDVNNVVIGTVRNKTAVEKKISDELGSRSNNSVNVVSKITGGKLDYIIANAGYISDWSGFDAIGKLGDTPQQLEEDLLYTFKVNVIGNVHLFNSYMPLILKGNAKKVITLTSGMADLDLINQYHVDSGAPYSISKGGMNVAVSKFHAQYAKDGVLFMGICPGLVDTGHADNLSQNQLEGAMRMVAIFEQYAPGAKQRAPEDAVPDVMKVMYESSLENGRGGAYISHLGSKRWL
ncbi:short chain dehydrogenase [Colletotrichum graminicola M1.001]|uniref:Short chain dehydrogenase n=1 Tax=Colletotrichum graminicola (strain M1.001 / M2 / FGSC 10212) TaxID=645133 RepID=E3Q3S0_COLGM|nr:short chain dehydrogenase [Colletotrichum graminicola M1.001]EFQ25672.1 short chain dehydrogenase [Colletotrichum graminicola M1.001]